MPNERTKQRAQAKAEGPNLDKYRALPRRDDGSSQASFNLTIQSGSACAICGAKKFCDTWIHPHWAPTRK